MVKITKNKGVNKDGYPTGGVDIGDSTGKVITDPRTEILTNQAKVHNEINQWCKKNLPSSPGYDGKQFPTDFEMFCNKQVALHLDKKELKKLLKKVAIYDKSKNKIYTYHSYKPSSLWGDKEWDRFKKNEDQIIMNKLSESDALKLLQSI